MRLVIPDPQDSHELPTDPARWAILPELCCLAAGGEPGSTLEISAAWLLLYTAAHVVDAIQDGDPDPKIEMLGGDGPAINTANGLYLSASRLINSLENKGFPKDLVAEITGDYLETILMMTGGQHLDLILSRVNLDQWWQIAAAKSGAFFSLACRSGARFGTTDQRKVSAYSDYGSHLGLMLQIIDDLGDFNAFMYSKSGLAPGLFGKSLAVAYAENVLPEPSKRELTQLIQSSSSGDASSEKLIDILDECGAGLYLATELSKHGYQAEMAVKHAQPVLPEAGEKLAGIIETLRIRE